MESTLTRDKSVLPWRIGSTIRVNRARIPPASAIVMRTGVLHMLVHAEPHETGEPGRGVDRRFQ